jgi:hypothetical protein
MLTAQVESFNSRTVQWGLNPMEGAMRGEISTVGGPANEGDAIDFAVLNREGLSRILFHDPRRGAGGGEAWMPAPEGKSEISVESKTGDWGPGGDLDLRFADWKRVDSIGGGQHAVLPSPWDKTKLNNTLNREGLSRLPVADPRMATREMFSLEREIKR